MYRILLFYGIIFLHLSFSCKPAKEKLLERETKVGAIRWDAWTSGSVTQQVEKTLGPGKYHDRLPWFASVINDSTVRIDGTAMDIMDKEIEYAAGAGLDYWAFLLYPESNSMSFSLRQYINSENRSKINFCLVLHSSFGVSDEKWPGELERVIRLIKLPEYQKVLNGRPLVYAFEVKLKGQFPYERFAEFLNRAKSEGLNPYCVFMGWDPPSDYKKASVMGFDAVSHYACDSDAPTFSELMQKAENNWEKARMERVPYIPLVTTGWDKQPRKDHPVSWELDHGYHRQKVFPSKANPEQIASHLSNALDFVKLNSDICKADAIIMYAWNENDEGGWLIPTWSPDGIPDTKRLNAIAKVLHKNN
jgi:hypothetical protein